MLQRYPKGSFFRGIIPLYVLSLLKKEDMYGYQLVQKINSLSGGRIVIQEGSLYPVLYRFVEQGLISDRKIQVSRRMTRVYYHLEPAGAEFLQLMIREFQDAAALVEQISTSLF